MLGKKNVLGLDLDIMALLLQQFAPVMLVQLPDNLGTCGELLLVHPDVEQFGIAFQFLL